MGKPKTTKRKRKPTSRIADRSAASKRRKGQVLVRLAPDEERVLRVAATREFRTIADYMRTLALRAARKAAS